ncbi:MAG: SIS domain-containing protein [Rickettsiales bacterium]
MSVIAALLSEHQSAAERFFATESERWVSLAAEAAQCLKNNGTIFFAGNGGSACDSMHIAGEFVGRFKRERIGLPAISLSADSGVITAIGNDYGFTEIFSRQIEALAKKGDLLIAMSTSGSSANILQAFAKARSKGVTTVLMTGERGKNQTSVADHLFAVPVTDTARVQEVHMLALHILAELVESELAGGA